MSSVSRLGYKMRRVDDSSLSSDDCKCVINDVTRKRLTMEPQQQEQDEGVETSTYY